MGSGWIRGQEHARGCEHFFLWDMRNLSGARILGAPGLEPGEVDIVAGGPPCQGFSVAGKRDVMDPRNRLVFEFARLVVEIAPKTFVMENVPGIQSMRTAEGIPVIEPLSVDGGGAVHHPRRRRLAAPRRAQAHARRTREPDNADERPGARQASLF